ncbi:hypothetical protein L1080_001700 [Rhodococcus sp. MSC1_016]|jgi:hypothetical protein|uniref:hypothetical protein n=1 Tax=Rhodococcus sp. MSC1_016 TaxID=2909266 RepID=UPI00202EF4CB|nr:hypothetical protein [Rhodococcus sp. MSC1_016]
MRTPTRRRVALFFALPATVLTVAGLAVAASGVATAGTMPTSGPTIAMTISNDTDLPMVLAGSSNPYGQWIQAPSDYLAPHSSQIVKAFSNDPNGVEVDATYSLPGGAQAVFSADNYSNTTDVDGTRVDADFGHAYGISSWIDSGYPNMNVGYHLYGHP